MSAWEVLYVSVCVSEGGDVFSFTLVQVTGGYSAKTETLKFADL